MKRRGPSTSTAGRLGLSLRARLSAYNKQRYALNKTKRTCVKCKRKAQPDRVLCAPCADANRSALKARRKQDMLMGICTRCHVDPARHGKTTCDACKNTRRRK